MAEYIERETLLQTLETVYTKAHDTCAFGVNAMESKKTADK